MARGVPPFINGVLTLDADDAVIFKDASGDTPVAFRVNEVSLDKRVLRLRQESGENGDKTTDVLNGVLQKQKSEQNQQKNLKSTR